MVRKKILAALALVTSSALLASCSSSSSSSVSISSVDTDSTLALVTVVEMDMLEDSVNPSSHGEKYKMLVVSKDGSTKVVEGAPTILNWTDASLFTADSKSYKWKKSDKDTVTRDNSENLDMVFSYTPIGTEGSILLALMTDGGDGDMTYTVVSEKESKSTTNRAFMTHFASCGDTTYGLDVNRDFMVVSGDDVDFESMTEEELDAYDPVETYDGRAELTLYKVAEGDDVSISSIGQHTAVMDDVSPLGLSMTCSGDEVMFLALQNEMEGGLYNRTQDPGEPVNFTLNDYKIGSAEEGGYGVLTLERWNIATGERTVVPVTGSDGKPFMKVTTLLMGSSMGSSSFHEGKFYWVDGLGRLVATDVQTGKSEALTDSLQTTSDMNKLAQMFTSFHEGNVTILVHSDADPSKDRIVSLEIPSGKELANVEVPNLSGLVKPIDMDDPDVWESTTSMTSVVSIAANPHLKG